MTRVRNAAWEAARRSIYPLPRGIRTQPVDLDYLILYEPCVACGEQTQLAYQGTPFHALCAIELAFYVELVKRGQRPALPRGSVLLRAPTPRLAVTR